MTEREILEVKEVFKTQGWQVFENWINEIKIPALSSLIEEPLANETNSLLNREALIGAKRELSKLALDFKSHINTKLENNE